MTKVLWDRFDKHKLGDLPRVRFEGRIIVVQTEAEAERAVSYLLSQPILGFDTETRPTFRPGPMNMVALLQVATPDTCFLFRLNKMGLPQSVIQLLSDKRVLKIVLSWRDDVQQLRRRTNFSMGDFFDLQEHVSYFGIEDRSLQKLYANVFGQKISKNQQLSNWEADALSDAQKVYAATDAWACIRIYEELYRLKETGDWELIKHEDNISE